MNWKDNERTRFRKFVRSLPTRKGVVVTVCPKCDKRLRETETGINALNAWAFSRDGYRVEFNGLGCCF